MAIRIQDDPERCRCAGLSTNLRNQVANFTPYVVVDSGGFLDEIDLHRRMRDIEQDCSM